MTDRQYRAFLNLMMCSDPWPVKSVLGFIGEDDGHDVMVGLANEEARKRGYEDWIEAFHKEPQWVAGEKA